MTNRGLAAGVFRAWGLMWAIYALVRIPQFVNLLIRNPYSGQKDMTAYALSSEVMYLGCQIVIAAFLMSKASWMASLVFPEEQVANFSFDAKQLRTILFSAIGLYFLLDGGSRVIGSAVLLLTRPRGDNQNAVAYLWQREPQTFAIGLVGAIAGAALFLGQGRINAWSGLHRLYRRLFGLREPSDV